MKLTDAVLEGILSDAIATGGTLDPVTCFVGAATAITDRGSATTLTDVTPALGTAATRVEVTTWTGPYRMNDGRWVVDSPISHFVIASSADGCTINNFYVASLVTAGVLKAFGTVVPGLTLVDETSRASLVLRVTIDPNGRWDANIAWNG